MSDMFTNRAIIEALTYPRMLIMSRLDHDQCQMHGYFNIQHKGCRLCDKAVECLWLNTNDDFSTLARKSTKALTKALEFSIEYVHVHVSRDDHNPRRCACESCVWIRDARHLVRQHVEA